MTPYYLRPLSAPSSPLQPLAGGGGSTNPNPNPNPNPYKLLQVEEEYNPLELLVRGKGVVSVHVHGGSNLKPMDDTTNVPLAPTT